MNDEEATSVAEALLGYVTDEKDRSSIERLIYGGEDEHACWEALSVLAESSTVVPTQLLDDAFSVIMLRWSKDDFMKSKAKEYIERIKTAETAA